MRLLFFLVACVCLVLAGPARLHAQSEPDPELKEQLGEARGQLSSLLAGPHNDLQELELRLNVADLEYRSGDTQSAIRNYTSALHIASDTGELTFNFNSQTYEGAGLNRAAEVISFADALHFLEDAPNLRFFELRGANHPSLFSKLAEAVTKSKVRSEVRALLSKHQPRTLGVELFEALLSDTPKQAVTQLAIHHAKDWPHIPAPHRDEIAHLLKYQIAGSADKPEITSENAAALQALMQMDLDVDLHQVDKLLAAETLEQTPYRTYSSYDTVVKLLDRIAFTEHDKAIAAAQHFLDLLDSHAAFDAESSPSQRRVGLRSHQFLSRLAAIPQLLPDAISIANSRGYLNQPSWVSLFAGRAIMTQDREGQDFWRAFLERTPWVAEAGQFQDPWSYLRNHVTLTDALTLRLKSRGDKMWPTVHAKLADKPNRTFGEDYVMALLALPGSPGLADFCVKRTGDLSKLSLSSAANLLASLRSKLPELVYPSELPPKLAKALEPLFAAETTYFEQRRLAWMKQTRLADDSALLTDQLNEAREVLDQTGRRDPKQALELFTHVCELTAAMGKDATDGKSVLARWTKDATSVPEVFDHAIEQACKANPQTKTYLLVYKTFDEQFQTWQGSRLIPFLERLGALDSGAKLNLYPTPQTGQVEDILGALQISCASYPAIRTRLQQALNAVQPRTLGVELVSAAIQGNARKSLLAFAKAHDAELATLPEPCQSDLARHLVDLMYRPDAEIKALPGFATALEGAHQKAITEASTILDDFMQMKKLDELVSKYQDSTGKTSPATNSATELGQSYLNTSPNHTTSAIARLLHVITTLHRSDSKKGGEAILKLITLVREEEAQLPRGWPNSPMKGLAALLCTEPSMVATASTLARSRDYFSDKAWMNKVIHNLLPYLDSKDAASTVAELANLGLLSEATTYNPIRWSLNSTSPLHGPVYYYSPQVSLLETLAQVITLTSPSPNTPHSEPTFVERVVTELRARQPQTFGSVLCAALLAGPNSPAWKDLCSRPADDFKNLPAQSKSLIFVALKSCNPLLDQKVLPPELQMFAPLQDASKEEAKQFVQSLEGTSTGRARPAPPAVGVANAFQAELRRLLAQQPSRAVELFQNTCAKAEGSKSPAERDSVPGSGTPTHTRINLLQQCLAQNSNLAGLAFALQCVEADHSGNMHPTGTQFMLNLPALLQQLWLQEGGAGAPALAAQSVMSQLDDRLEEISPALLIPTFYDWMVDLSHADRREIIKWAASLHQGDKAYSLAHELAITGQLAAAASAALTKSLPAEAPAPDLSAYWKHYQDLLEDSHINPCTRAAVANHLSNIYGELIPNALLIAGTRNFVESYSSGLDISSTFFYPLLQHFADAPKDEAWTQVANAYWDKWDAWQGPNATIKIIWTTPMLLSPVMSLASRIEEEPKLLEFMNKYHPLNLEIAAPALSSWGKANLALGMIEDHSNKTDQWTANPHLGTISPSRVPEILGAIEAAPKATSQPEAAWLAEIMVLHHSQPPMNVRAHWQGYREFQKYFTDLAERISETKATDPALYRQVLSLLTITDAVGVAPMDEQLTLAAQKVTSEELQRMNTEQRSWTLTLLGCHAARCALKGDFATGAAVFKRLETDLAADPKRLGQAQIQFVDLVMSCMLGGWPDLSKDIQNHTLTLFNEWLTKLAPRSDQMSGQFLALAKMYGFWAQILAFPNFTDLTVNASQRTSLCSTLPLLIASQCTAQSPTPEIRRQLLLALTQYPVWQKHFADYSHPLHQLLRQNNLWTHEEIVPIADKLARAFPHAGETAMDLAEWTFDLDRRDVTLQLMDLAIEQSAKDTTAVAEAIPANPSSGNSRGSTKTTLSDIKLRKAGYLIRMGKEDEARELLNAMGDQSLPMNTLKERDALKALLQHR